MAESAVVTLVDKINVWYTVWIKKLLNEGDCGIVCVSYVILLQDKHMTSDK
jgi:hypothetical protein